MANFYETVLAVLKSDERFVAEDGTFLRNAVYEAAMKMDKNLIRILLTNDETRTRFFVEVDGVKVFDKIGFAWIINNRQFLPDSYTRFKNKIGLADETGALISASGKVELVFPYKDCVLEGGQTKEDQNRSEVFYNETLSPNNVDRLLYPKIFSGAVKYTINGVEKVTVISETDNLVVKGNNLLVLASLLKRYEGRVKCIYIDPPYNTGSDSFRYNDNFNQSSWLLFMKNRLEIAKRLLRRDGVIFVQSDDMEHAYLKVLMDELFPGLYVNTITVETKANSGASGGGEDKRLKKNVEFILCYANSGFTRFNDSYIKVPLADFLNRMKIEGKNNHYNSVYISLGKREYFKTIKDGSGNDMVIYKHSGYETKSVSKLASEEGVTEIDIYRKYFDRICTTENAQTSIRTRVLEATDSNDTFYSVEYVPVSGRNKGELTTIYFVGEKKRLISWFKNVCIEEDGEIFKREKIGSHWSGMNWNNVNKEGGVSLPQGQKPEELIKRILDLTTDEGDIVLDFFAGTGTTAAVAAKMNRQYITIEQMDYIEELTIKRLNNVINGDTKGISEQVEWQGGGSFVYCELAKLNQTIVEEIESATDDVTLSDIYGRMVKSGFISYKVNPAVIDAAADDYAALSLDDKKKFLMEILDKNLLYVNYCDIDDEEFGISNEDKTFTRSFYREG